MNLIFLSPIWLAALLPITLGGWQLLRASRPPTAIFTIPEFWPAQAAFASTRASYTRKAPDWPQVCLLLAAAIAALALARPAWKIAAQPAAPALQIHAVGRKMENQSTAQVFVHGDADASNRIVIRLVAGKTTLTRRVTAAAMARGIVFTGVPAILKITVFVRAINSSGQATELANITLLRRIEPRPLAVNVPSPLPRSLQRLLQLMHNIVWNHPRQMPTIWIISNTADRRRYQAFLAGLSRKRDGVVVLCLGSAGGPQMKVSGIDRIAPAVRPVIIQPDGQLFDRVDFSPVRVKRVYRATFKAGWHAEIRTGAHVWLAKKTDSTNGVVWYWLASPPTDSFTDWQHHASFVVFFANLLAHLTHSTVDTGQTWWRAKAIARRTPSSRPAATIANPATAGSSRPLAPALTVISVILTALSLLGIRARRTRRV